VTLAYHENFNDDKVWSEFSNNGCRTDVTSGIYQVDVDSKDRECLAVADNNDSKPEKPFRTYGEFEVTGYISGENKDSNHAYGIWLNGKGGDTQYVFRIYPNVEGCSNGGKWELKRRKSGAGDVLLASSNCDTRIKRGYGGDYKQTIQGSPQEQW
jgi:hypothetical protein